MKSKNFIFPRVQRMETKNNKIQLYLLLYGYTCSNWLSILEMIELPCSLLNEVFVLISIGDVELVS